MRWFYISEWGSYLTFEPSIMNGSIDTKILIKKKNTLHKIRQQLKVILILILIWFDFNILYTGIIPTLYMA